MNPDDMIITQMGLLFTSFRYARRALEDIERNTANYTGIAFAPLLAGGAHFGAPPMVNGALKVHIVNVNDLTASSGGGLIEGLLGGAGRFIGGLFGGLIGGTIGSAALPYNLVQFAKITDALHKIVDRIKEMTPGFDKLIGDVKELMNSFKGPADAAQPATAAAATKPLDWEKVLGLGTKAIQGLILLIPIVVGALAFLITRLDSVKIAIVDLFEFGLRNALMFRGVLLVVIFDTVAALARLAAGILSAAAGPVGTIIQSAFNIVGALAELATDVLRMIGKPLADAVNGITNWLFKGLGNLLLFIGDTRVFRLIQHVVQVLPLILPALIRFRDPAGRGLPSGERRMLEEAAKTPLPGLVGPGGGKAGRIASFPDLSAGLPKAGDWATLIGKHGAAVSTELKNITATTSTLLTDEAARLHGMDFQKGISGDLKNVGDQVNKLTEPLQKAKKEMEEQRTKTGLEDIADAYAKWLSGAGFKSLLGQITDYFRTDPTLIEKAGQAASKEEARATVEIGRMFVEILPPNASAESTSTVHSELADSRDSPEDDDDRGYVYDRYAGGGDLRYVFSEAGA